EISTQGDRNIVVGLPGEPDEATLDLVRKSAQLQFRPVLYVGMPQPTAAGAPEGVEDETVDRPEPTNPSELAWITEEVDAQFAALDCTNPENLTNGELGDPDGALVACRADGAAKLILGPVELTGEDVSTASAGPTLNPQTGAATGGFEVRLDLTDG